MMYLIIGYKPSYDDYCRGCLMISYNSNSVMERVKTPLEAAAFIANIEVFDSSGSNWNWNIITSNMINDDEHYFSSDLESDDIPIEINELLEQERLKALNAFKIKKSKEEEEKKTKNQCISTN